MALIRWMKTDGVFHINRSETSDDCKAHLFCVLSHRMSFCVHVKGTASVRESVGMGAGFAESSSGDDSVGNIFFSTVTCCAKQLVRVQNFVMGGV